MLVSTAVNPTGMRSWFQGPCGYPNMQVFNPLLEMVCVISVMILPMLTQLLHTLYRLFWTLHAIQSHKNEMAAMKLCRQPWWRITSVRLHDRRNFGFLQMLSVDERVGTESRARGPAVHIALKSAEVQMSSRKGIWAVNREAMLTSPTIVFLSPQTRCLGSDCRMDEEGWKEFTAY